MKKFNVGIQLYGVRNAMAADFEGTLTALRDMGYEYVEFAGYHGKTSEEIKAILDKLGLKCVSVHQVLDFFNEDPQGAVDYLKGFGVKYVVIPWYDKNKLVNSSEWDATVANFNEKAELLAKNDMVLGYHNHEYEFEKHEGRYLHDYIMECVPDGKIIPELDTCWVHYAGINPADKIKEFAGKVPVVHLKDFVCKNLGSGPVYDLIGTASATLNGTRDDNGFEFRPLGMGRQDFASILAACEESGTETVIVEQDKVYEGMTELEAAKISRDYLKNTFNI